MNIATCSNPRKNPSCRGLYDAGSKDQAKESNGLFAGSGLCPGCMTLEREVAKRLAHDRPEHSREFRAAERAFLRSRA